MSDQKHQSINPVIIDDSTASTGVSQITQPRNKDNNNFLIYGFVGALVFIAAAILIVPALISDKNDSDVATVLPEETLSNISLNTPDETPWADAQLSKARRDAQEILAELLGVQTNLENALVEIWAKDEFDQVISSAAEGDVLYADRQFDQSIELYQRALDTALKLEIQVRQVALDYQQKGIDLLAKNKIDEAVVSLEIALQAFPNLSNTADILARAKNREQVLRLMELSEITGSNPDTLETAKQQIIDAQVLDNEYQPLKDKRFEIETQIVERDYRQQMTAGFNALQEGKYEQAEAAFQKASQIKPNETASSEALQQVEAQKLNTGRQRALNAAVKLEKEEQWLSALDKYNALIQEDNSLTAARLGKLRAEARVNLDNDVQLVLDNPLDLQNQSKWEAAQKTLKDAQAIINPGGQLKAQTAQLESIIKTARTPVIVKIQSDNQTEVEVYRIGPLGMFSEQAMNLNPGKYVIVGKRNGYQDVRVDLVLDGSNSEVTVPVICSVTI